MDKSKKKIRVVYEQWIIPHYKVPFYSELAKNVDLLVVVSKEKNIDGTKNTKEGLPFKYIETEENENGDLFHPKILQILQDFKADVYVSFGVPLVQIFSNKKYRNEIHKIGVKTVWMGIEGFKVRKFLPWLIKTAIIGHKIYFRDLSASWYVDHFATYSTYTKKFIHFTKFIPNSKISVAYNAYDVTKLNTKYHQLLNSGVTREKNTVIYVGRFTQWKRLDVLVKSFSEVIKQIPDAKLKIIGDGSEFENIKQLISDLKLGHHIELLPGIYDDLILCEHLTRASLYVLPGLGGLGLNTAMACGLPAIYNHADGTEKDLFKDKVNGWFYDGTIPDLTNKIVSALKDPEKLVEMGKICEDIVVNKVTVPNMVKVYLDVFNKILYKK